MRIFKVSQFSNWAQGEGLTDKSLIIAAREMNDGLVDANLGGSLYKKRVATVSRGKSGSFRTLLAFKVEDKAFFIYGFAKNKRANITDREKKALKVYAKALLEMTDRQITLVKADGEIIEVEVSEDE